MKDKFILFVSLIVIVFPLFGIYQEKAKTKEVLEKAKAEYEQKYKDITTITQKMLRNIDDPEELYFAGRDRKRNENAFGYSYRYQLNKLLTGIAKTNPEKALHFLKYFTGFNFDMDLTIIAAFSKYNKTHYLDKVKAVYKDEPAMLTYIEYLADQKIATLIKAMGQNKTIHSYQKELNHALTDSLQAYLDSEEKAKNLLEQYPKKEYKVLSNYSYQILKHIDDIAYLEKFADKREYWGMGINNRINELKHWEAREKERKAAKQAYLEKKRLKKIKLKQRKAKIAHIDSLIEMIKIKERQARIETSQKPINYKLLLLNLLIPVAIGAVSLVFIIFHTIKK